MTLVFPRLKHLIYYAVIAIAVAAAARQLEDKPFWIDEAIAVMPAKTIIPYQNFDTNFMPWQIKHNVWDPAFPLYRVTLGLFTRIFGFSEASTRGFSLLFAVLTLVPFFAFLYRLRGYDFALRSVALVVALPAFLGLSSEARYYSFAMFWIFLSAYACLRFIETNALAELRFLYVVLLCALLAHAMVYLIFPVVLIALFWNRVEIRQYWKRPEFLLLAFLVGGYVLYFSDTLPFLHTVDCSNRTIGCDRTLTYYLGTVWNTLAGIGIRYETFDIPATLPHTLMGLLLGVPGSILKQLSLAHIAFALGAFCLWKEQKPGVAHFSREGILLLMVTLPLVLLSLKEYKAHKYYLIFSLPVMGYMLSSAFGIFARFSGAARHCAEIFFFLMIVVSLRVDAVGAIRDTNGFARDTLEKVSVKRTDNFERIDAQVRFFRHNLKPGDVIVSTLDDASLGHYLNRFVYGFLNNHHNDAFFLGLLNAASANGNKVYLVDTLPEHNYCLTDESEPRSLDCRRKYAEFYSICISGKNQSCIVVKPANLR